MKPPAVLSHYSTGWKDKQFKRGNARSKAGAAARKAQMLAEGSPGFNTMEKEEVVAIASAAGKRAHELGRAHEFTSIEASAAACKANAKLRAQKRIERELAKWETKEEPQDFLRLDLILAGRSTT